jgi:hypothetical protein
MHSLHCEAASTTAAALVAALVAAALQQVPCWGLGG